MVCSSNLNAQKSWRRRSMASLWDDIKARAVLKKIARAKLQAKLPVSFDGTVNDYGIEHVQEVVDAGQDKYTNLTNRVKKEVLKVQDKAMVRRLKTVAK